MDADLWYLKRRAEDGHKSEQLALGKRYFFGDDKVPKDWELARTLFTAAKRQGCYEAAEFLAQMEGSFEN